MNLKKLSLAFCGFKAALSKFGDDCEDEEEDDEEEEECDDGAEGESRHELPFSDETSWAAAACD